MCDGENDICQKGSKSQLLEFIQTGATGLQGQVSYHDDQDDQNFIRTITSFKWDLGCSFSRKQHVIASMFIVFSHGLKIIPNLDPEVSIEPKGKLARETE